MRPVGIACFARSPLSACWRPRPRRSSRKIGARYFREIDRSLQELTGISGLKAKKRIHYDLITRDKVNEFLKDRVKESVKPEESRAEEMTLKKLGFVPADFNLEKSTVDLLTEQAAAFYDYHKKKLFLTDWAPSANAGVGAGARAGARPGRSEFPSGAIHQRRRQERRQRTGADGGDGRAGDLADDRSAGAEGEASRSPAIRAARCHERRLRHGSSQFPVFNSVPLYLRETLIFPYTEGARFQNAVYAKMGKAAFAEVFRRPPETTQQILHPAKYFDHVEPATPAFPEGRAGQRLQGPVRGNAGRARSLHLMRQYGTREQADSISPHWKGGRYWLIENKSKSRVILRYVSEWDSPEVAQDFFRFYQQVLRKKWKNDGSHRAK